MPFEFQCPQGHLLSAEPNQVGQQVQCPLCQTQFAIPAAPGAPIAEAPPQPAAPDMGLDPLGGIGGLDSVLPADDSGLDYAGDSGGQFGDIDVYSIPCPNDHILETPAEMLGQHAMCPHCQAQFELREEDSLEYKERRRIEIEKHDAIVGEKWLKRAIWIAAIVGLSLLILVIMSIVDNGSGPAE